MKICSKCKIEKSFLEFNKDKTKSDGFYSSCLSCKKEKEKLYRLKYKEQLKIKSILHKKEKKEYYKEYHQQWYQKNKEKVDNLSSIWRKNNPEKSKQIAKRASSKPKELIKSRLRNRVFKALKYKKFFSISLTGLIGCSKQDLQKYLEKQFKGNMSWSNYGEWHIDHILPLSKFALQNSEELEIACHYTNLQPLWAKENMEKSNKIL